MPTIPTTVFLPIGIPGIGKSTLLKQQAGGAEIANVSRDEIRSEVNGGDATFIPENEPKITRLSYQRLRKALRESRKRDGSKPKHIALDMTNINAWGRKDYLQIVQKFAETRPVVLKVFHFPNDVDLAMQRQQGRERQVDQAIIEKYADKFQRFDTASETDTGKAKRLSVEVYDVAEDGTLRDAPKFSGQRLSLYA